MIEEFAGAEVVVEAIDACELRPPWQPSQGAEVGHHRALGVLLAEGNRVAPHGRPEVADGERVHPDPPSGDSLKRSCVMSFPTGRPSTEGETK